MGIDSLFKLGLQLEQTDDPAGAEAAYGRADQRGHAAAATHPIVRSLEPGEDWRWCYIDEAYV